MSFDFYMAIDTGGEYPACVEDIGNITYNVSAMFTKALGSNIREFEDKTGLELIPIFEKALSHVSNPENFKEYQSLNPSNGWGSHEGATEIMDKILKACRKHPKAIFKIS